MEEPAAYAIQFVENESFERRGVMSRPSENDGEIYSKFSKFTKSLTVPVSL